MSKEKYCECGFEEGYQWNIHELARSYNIKWGEAEEARAAFDKLRNSILDSVLDSLKPPEPLLGFMQWAVDILPKPPVPIQNQKLMPENPLSGVIVANGLNLFYNLAQEKLRPANVKRPDFLPEDLQNIATALIAPTVAQYGEGFYKLFGEFAKFIDQQLPKTVDSGALKDYTAFVAKLNSPKVSTPQQPNLKAIHPYNNVASFQKPSGNGQMKI